MTKRVLGAVLTRHGHRRTVLRDPRPQIQLQCVIRVVQLLKHTRRTLCTQIIIISFKSRDALTLLRGSQPLRHNALTVCGTLGALRRPCITPVINRAVCYGVVPWTKVTCQTHLTCKHGNCQQTATKSILHLIIARMAHTIVDVYGSKLAVAGVGGTGFTGVGLGIWSE